MSSLALRFRQFPYLVIGWGLLAVVCLAAPDRFFLTHRQGVWVGLAFLSAKAAPLLRASAFPVIPVESRLCTRLALTKRHLFSFR